MDFYKLPDVLVKYIVSFIPCSLNNKFSLSCKFINNYYECILNKHSSLNGCKAHKSNIFNIVKKINNYNKNSKTIHFDTEEMLCIAKPYLYKLDQVSHFCCNNTGVMFCENGNKNKKYFFTPLNI